MRSIIVAAFAVVSILMPVSVQADPFMVLSLYKDHGEPLTDSEVKEVSARVHTLQGECIGVVSQQFKLPLPLANSEKVFTNPGAEYSYEQCVATLLKQAEDIGVFKGVHARTDIPPGGSFAIK